jgi:ribosome-binding protein aMBF1 (putative translation factor)
MSTASQNRAGNGIVVKSSNQIDKLLGGRLRDKRTLTGWSQEQLAEKLQIDPKDI